MTAPAVAAEEAQPAETITWGACTDQTLINAGAECGYLPVPLDYSRPRGEKIQLALSRVKHKTPDARYQGVLLTIPGGPGGSGLLLATRGPRVTNHWLQRSKSYADACAEKNSRALLENIKTTDTVKDMESIRKALGAEQLNFYGYSYGTYLGQVYGTLYPQHVRRMVLDSTVDPRNVWYQANLNQDLAYDVNLDIWFGWVASHDAVYHLGKTQAAVKQVFDEQLKKLAAVPAGGYIGPDEFLDVFQQASYYQLRWPLLGDALAKFVNKGDWQTMKGLFEGFGGRGDDNSYAVYLAVQCTDVKWPQSWQQWKRDNWRTYEKAPYFTWQNAWYNAPCLYWPAKPGKPVKVDGSKVPSVLMIGETLDAATPYEGSLEVRSRFPGARLIGQPGGTSHAITPRGNACVDNRIAGYLATGALPERKPGRTADVECAPLPLPVPA